MAVALPLAAGAAEPATQLAEAESSASAAQGEIAEAEAALGSARADLSSARARALPVDHQAATASAQARKLTLAASARRVHARARIAALNSAHAEEVEEDDEEVANQIGLALTALVILAIALGWSWFRASAAVAWLASLDLWPAVGISIGAGLCLLIAGGVLLQAGGAIEAIGSFIGTLGLSLPAAFLLARHSAQVQRARSKPLLGRERLPGWVAASTAVLAGLIALASFGNAASASGPDPAPISDELTASAGPLSPGTRAAIAAASSRADHLQAQADALDQKRSAARSTFVDARSTLNDAEDRLASAESSANRFSNQLVATEEREARQAAQEEAQAAREAEAAEAQAAEEAASECNPNYSGCLDPTASDYDCEGGSGDGPLYTGTVEVIGYDEYGLDEDGDGIGCDP